VSDARETENERECQRKHPPEIDELCTPASGAFRRQELSNFIVVFHVSPMISTKAERIAANTS
jgi:hypothetical protein